MVSILGMEKLCGAGNYRTLPEVNVTIDGVNAKYKLRAMQFSFDTLCYIIAIAIFLIIGVGSLADWNNTDRMSAERAELGMLRDAVVQYMGLHNSGRPPENLEVLLNSPVISAANAVDGVDHSNLITTTNDRWNSGSVTDVWGTKYEYTITDTYHGTIVSKGSGTTLKIDF